MNKLFFIPLILASIFTIAQTPVELNGSLSVDGVSIINESGNVVSLAGPSLFWSNTGWGGEKYYTSEVVSWVASDWNATIIRASMGVDENGGYLSDPSNYGKVKTVIDAAIASGIYVIVDWHSHHAEDYKQESIDFFSDLAETYGSHKNIIYEIYNEPLQVSWSNVIKPYAEAVVAAIRAKDPDNLIIVGTPSWSQDVDVAANDPIIGFSNIAYSLHFYAGTHSQFLRDKATAAINKGIALVVTEWGAVNADGNGAIATASTTEWMDFLKLHQLTHCNWALNDKNEGASALKSGASVTGGWLDDQLTPSGKLIKGVIAEWTDSEPLETYPLESVCVYPTPSKDFLTVDLGTNYKKITGQIINTGGQVVLGLDAQKINQLILDMSSYKSGVYFLNLTADGKLLNMKLIKF